MVNRSDATIHVNPLNVTVVDLDGSTYGHDTATYSFVKPMQAVNVLPGNSAGGMIAFLINDKTGPAKVVYEIGLLEPTVIVDLTQPPDKE